jgi:GMP synthase-like glutamine amidotransferase
MTVWIFRHAAHEGPGYLLDVLERARVGYGMVEIDRGHLVPTGLGETRGLVFMGGPMSVHDPLPWIEPATRLIRQAVAADVPVLGHCLGAQLLAGALGAGVRPNAVPEIGWLPVTRAPGEPASDWLGSLPESFPVYHWHGETFDLPAGATRLLESADCPNQAFALGRHLGIQFHVELTPEMVIDWSSRLDLPPSRTVQSTAAMRLDLERRTQAPHGIADVLYGRWLARVFGLSPAASAPPAARLRSGRTRVPLH